MKKFTKLFLSIPIMFGIVLLMSGNAQAACDPHFTYSPGNALNSVIFKPAMNPMSSKYFWTFGDGTSSNMMNPTHNYTSPGTYWACLTVSDSTSAGVCKNTWCDSVKVLSSPPPPPACNAHFTYKAGSTLYSVVFTGSTSSSTTTKYFWKFGDGGTSTMPNPFHTYPGAGTYWACLTVSDSTNAGKCTNTYCDSIHIGNPPPPPPPCDAHFTHKTGNTINSVLFTPAASSTLTRKYFWDFGDGTTSNQPNPLHTYPGAGAFWACLTVSDSTSAGLCKNTWCDSIHVVSSPPPPPPVCIAKFTYKAGSTLYSVVFTGSTSTSTTTKYFWTFGDGGTSTMPNPFHTYPGAGTYWACLTISDSTNAGKCTNTFCDSVRVGNPPPPPPPCDAHFTHKAGSTLYSVVFTPAASSTITRKYFWDFGDGTTSNQPNPLHTYPGSGAYWACLTVSDSTNAGVCKNTWCDSIKIGNVSLPACNAHFTHKAGPSNFSEAFTPPSGSTISTKYLWSFGDGGTSTQPNPTHTYPGPGAYWACLTVSDSTSAGVCKNTWCDSVKIGNPPPPPSCDAHFKYLFTNTGGVAFTSVINPPGTKFFWNFGDGTTANIPNPTHTFANPGVYWVCLTVSDSLASGVCKNTWCDSVHIKTPPPPLTCDAHFATKPASTLNTVGFAPAPNPVGTHYFWDFGDGTTSTMLNPLHTFPKAGAYWVCLSVIDTLSSGICQDKWCDSVRIGIPPPSNTSICNAHFKYFKTSTLTHTAQFNAALNPPGTVYNWSFGDGTFANVPNPIHTFTTGGPYNVCLIVSLTTAKDTCKNQWCMSVYPRAGSVQDDPNGSASIIVYPNPMVEYSTVTLANIENPVSFSIYDAMGRLVYRKDNLSDGSFNIGSELNPGMYFYRASDEVEIIASGKLIVQ